MGVRGVGLGVGICGGEEVRLAGGVVAVAASTAARREFMGRGRNKRGPGVGEGW